MKKLNLRISVIAGIGLLFLSSQSESQDKAVGIPDPGLPTIHGPSQNLSLGKVKSQPQSKDKERRDYERNIKGKVSDLKKTMDNFNDVFHKEDLATLGDKLGDLKKRFEKLTYASPTKWKQLKPGIDRLVNDLENSLDVASRKIAPPLSTPGKK